MKMPVKEISKYSIVGVALFALYQIVPPLFNAGKIVFDWGSKYNIVQSAIAEHSVQIKSNSARIDKTERDIRSWRAVWCISELSKKQRIPQAVSSACTEWIREP